ncbi:MAG TPA: MlaD family protein [Candidatus Acidoferrum sp.]|nr:MlaD family protein [Candidatus Acidoferrum sp.]
MTERQMQLRIGVLVLTAILLFMGFVLSVGRRSALFEGRYSLSTSFSSTEGLAVGAPVRLAGVTVGNVTRIAFGRDLADRRINLTLSVEQRVQDRIRQDSVASIGTIGLVGDKVLDVTVGSADRPVLQAGERLTSVDPVDYSGLLQKGDQILGHVSRISDSLDEFLAGGDTAAGKRSLNEMLRSLRNTVMEVEKGSGFLHDVIYGKEGAELLGRLDRTAQSLERTVRAIESEHGLLHGLIYTPQEETLGRLNRALAGLDDIVAEAKGGRGLLHTLIYDPQATQFLTHLNRASEELEGLVRSAREGKGLVPSLLFDPQGAKVLDDVQAAAQKLRAVAADLQVITTQLRQGEGTIGGLLQDPTIYEDLSALLRGANRSFLLRGLIRSTVEEGSREKR